MNQYVTGAVIKELREKNKMTQLQLAERLGVTDKSISKWENLRGLPDITLLEPIAKAFKISVTELISGNTIHNANVSANMLRSKFYVCPICGNVIHSMGDSFLPGWACAPVRQAVMRKKSLRWRRTRPRAARTGSQVPAENHTA